MPTNPYEPPGDISNPQDPRQSPKRRVYAAVLGWLAFFLLPSVGVLACHAYPGPPFWDAPTGDTILSRLSLALGAPMEPLFFVSLLGCFVIVGGSPFSSLWKVIAVLAWFPLMVFQLMALMFALVLLGRPFVT